MKIIVRWHVAGDIRTTAAFIAGHDSLRLARIVTVGDKPWLAVIKSAYTCFRNAEWYLQTCGPSLRLVTSGLLTDRGSNSFDRNLNVFSLYKLTLCNTDWTRNVFALILVHLFDWKYSDRGYLDLPVNNDFKRLMIIWMSACLDFVHVELMSIFTLGVFNIRGYRCVNEALILTYEYTQASDF